MNWGECSVVLVFADLNGRDDRGLYAALAEDADGSVNVGDTISVIDDEESTYVGHVAEIDNGLIYFSLEPGTARRASSHAGDLALA